MARFKRVLHDPTWDTNSPLYRRLKRVVDDEEVWLTCSKQCCRCKKFTCEWGVSEGENKVDFYCPKCTVGKDNICAPTKTCPTCRTAFCSEVFECTRCEEQNLCLYCAVGCDRCEQPLFCIACRDGEDEPFLCQECLESDDDESDTADESY